MFGVVHDGGMRHRIELPLLLGPAFSLREAAAAGVGRARRDSRDLHRPFHGVRSRSIPSTFLERIECHHPRMKARQRYVGRTAARLWGLPLPHRWQPSEPIHIAVPLDVTPPQTAGVKGRRLAAHRAVTWELGSALVVDPLAALFTIADELNIEETVIVLDALLTSADGYPGLIPGRPVHTVDDIESKLRLWRAFPGHRTIRAALPLARERVESPKETETRRLITRAGLPEPVVQHEVRDGGRLIARSDLAYPDLRIAIEYEGDGHRTDKTQWRRDIQRQRDLEDRGWLVVRLTQHDLEAGAEALLSRIRRAILSRTA